MSKWKHLTYTDRLQIEKMYNRGETKKCIAADIGVTLRTIYNELPRGLYAHTLQNDFKTWEVVRYSATKAQNDYDRKATAKGCDIKLGKNYALVAYLEQKIIREKFSPAAALATLPQKPFSAATLYSYIDRGCFPNLTVIDLPEKGRKKQTYRHVQKAVRCPSGTSIEKRPEFINRRDTFGHWEMDCVIGKSKGKGQAFLTFTERLTRFELIFHLKEKNTRSVVSTLDGLCRKLTFSNIFQSITVDNGSEFSNCAGMEYTKQGEKRTSIYYCHPYTSCEKGSNERANRIIRRFAPKGQSLKAYTQKQCTTIARWMNNYPRRILNWKTPAQLVADLCPDLISFFEN